MADFSDFDFRRMEQAVKRVERARRTEVKRPTGPRLSAPANRWFWTTSSIAGATKSGTTVSNATLTQGSGTARMCPTGTGGVVAPDVSAGAADTTIYSGLTGTIDPGTFVFCSMSDGVWVVTVVDCP